MLCIIRVVITVHICIENNLTLLIYNELLLMRFSESYFAGNFASGGEGLF